MLQPLTSHVEVHVEVELGVQRWQSGLAKVSSFSRQAEWLEGNLKASRYVSLVVGQGMLKPLVKPYNKQAMGVQGGYMS